MVKGHGHTQVLKSNQCDEYAAQKTFKGVNRHQIALAGRSFLQPAVKHLVRDFRHG